MRQMPIGGGPREVPSARGSRLKRGHLFTMLATALVATSFPVGGAIAHGLDSLVLTFLRFTLAAVLFAAHSRLALRLGHARLAGSRAL